MVSGQGSVEQGTGERGEATVPKSPNPEFPLSPFPLPPVPLRLHADRASGDDHDHRHPGGHGVWRVAGGAADGRRSRHQSHHRQTQHHHHAPLRVVSHATSAGRLRSRGKASPYAGRGRRRSPLCHPRPHADGNAGPTGRFRRATAAMPIKLPNSGSVDSASGTYRNSITNVSDSTAGTSNRRGQCGRPKCST